MRVLICGDRNWEDVAAVEREIFCRLAPGDVVIHGACRGADLIADIVAEHFGLEREAYPADWKIGRSAGPIRNKQMLVEGKPDEVWAFHANIAESKGTRNMLAQAKAAGISTILFMG